MDGDFMVCFSINYLTFVIANKTRLDVRLKKDHKILFYCYNHKHDKSVYFCVSINTKLFPFSSSSSIDEHMFTSKVRKKGGLSWEQKAQMVGLAMLRWHLIMLNLYLNFFLDRLKGVVELPFSNNFFKL